MQCSHRACVALAHLLVSSQSYMHSELPGVHVGTGDDAIQPCCRCPSIEHARTFSIAEAHLRQDALASKALLTQECMAMLTHVAGIVCCNNQLAPRVGGRWATSSWGPASWSLGPDHAVVNGCDA